MTGRLHINRPDVWGGAGFPMNQGVVEPAGRRVHVTGQVAWDAGLNVIGPGDAYAQTLAAFENIRKILEPVGGRLSDIVALTTYFVRDEDRDAINRARLETLSRDTGPASTGIRVAGLWVPELLVELTPVAVIPEARFTPPDTGT